MRNLARAIPALAQQPPPAEIRATLTERGTRVSQVVTAVAGLGDQDVAAAEQRLDDQAVGVGEQVSCIVTGEVRGLQRPKAARTPGDRLSPARM